jgi:hypothetical protein
VKPAELSFAPAKGKKSFTLRLIQTAWVAEVAVLLVYTMAVVLAADVARVDLWLRLLPVLTASVVGQGAAASIGPLMADKMKQKEVKDEH